MDRLAKARLDDRNLDKLLNRFEKENPTKQLVLLFKAGSHFFDLNGPDSDTDYRGIYIDPYQDSFESNTEKIYLLDYKTKEGKNEKNSKDDCDVTLFSLSSLLLLLKQGDFNCQELLFCPEDKILYKTPIYDELVKKRREYLVNDTSSFIGFIRKEAKRYSVNVFHYDIQMRFVEFLKKFPLHNTLADHWEEIKLYANANPGEIKFSDSKVSNAKTSKNLDALVIASRMHISTGTVKYTIEAIEGICQKYGHRQRSMAQDGKEYKGLYHSLRLIYEANDVLDFGELRFPFDEGRMSTLRSIKNGTVDQGWLFDTIDSEIEKLRIRDMNLKSNRREVEARLDRTISALRGRMSVHQKLIPLHNVISLRQ